MGVYFLCYENRKFCLVIIGVGNARRIGFDIGIDCRVGVCRRNTIYNRFNGPNCIRCGGPFYDGVGIPVAKGGRKYAWCGRAWHYDGRGICFYRRNVIDAVFIHIKYGGRGYNDLCRRNLNNIFL